MGDVAITSNLADSSANLLPAHLQERVRCVHESMQPRPSGDFVLYWMCSALRTDENPALDVAKHFAHELGLPLLVYHGTSQRYAFASDRHHSFLLQGARDVQQSLSEMGLCLTVHVERPDCDQPVLAQLANQAALIVTEDMPVQAPARFLSALVRTCMCDVLAVDTACVVSPNLVGQAFDRAFAYRDATRALYAERTLRSWPECEVSCVPVAPERLGVPSIDLCDTSLADVIAACDIDHSVGPVVDTRGGSHAGYDRWNRFRDQKLATYAKSRNNALSDGVSRMSAYLHYGMVSPFRLAREAASLGGPGAEKYLDELLIWRELAYCFCRFESRAEGWRGLPTWARKTLEDHAADARPYQYDWETLSRGRTHNELWNAAQKSLLIHGELHNNLRMTWGKALLQWTANPQQALRLMVDLNHRYALDGRDPASYGGILWCLGQFDRPFQPEHPVTGSVRQRPLEQHATRLDPRAYHRKVSRSRAAELPRVAIIGGGVSGSIAARVLSDHGLSVSLYERSGRPGGRASSQRHDTGLFDHGAQYFTARSPIMRRYVESWVQQGLVMEWQAPIVAFDAPRKAQPIQGTRRFTVRDGMQSLCKHLMDDRAEVHYRTQVRDILPSGQRYRLVGESAEELGTFDRVVLAMPPEQALRLTNALPELSAAVRPFSMEPCWALLLSVADGRPCDWAGAFVNVGPLRWIALNSSKPTCQSPYQNWVVHARSDWSSAHLDRPTEWIADRLLDEFNAVTGLAVSQPAFMKAHRWRYAIYNTPETSPTGRMLTNQDASIMICGDWAAGARIEGAFLSGCAAAGRILSQLPGPAPEQAQLPLF